MSCVWWIVRVLATSNVFIYMHSCISSHSTLGTQVPRFSPEYNNYLKSKPLVEQVLPHGEASSSKQKIWMKQIELKTLSYYSVEI